MKKTVTAEGLDQEHRRKSQHCEAAIHPLRVGAPAEGGDIRRGG